MITKCILLYFVILLCVNFGDTFKHCTMNMTTNECMCPKGYKNNNGICEAECTLPCGKGICFKPNECRCFDGYKIDIKRLIRQTGEIFPVCTPSCKNCLGECVAPNKCVVTTTAAPATTTAKVKSGIPTTSTVIAPTTITTSTTVETPTTSKTVTPTITTASAAITSITVKPKTSAPNLTNSTTTTPATTTTAIPTTTQVATTITTMSSTSVSSTGLKKDTQPSTTVMYKFSYETTTEQLVVAQTLDPSLLERKAEKEVWLMPEWFALTIWLVVAATIVLLLVWRRKPIIRYFKGGSYVVEDDRPGRNQVQYSKTAQEDYC